LIGNITSSVKDTARDAAASAAEIAREADEKRKMDAKAKLRNITDDIDMNLEKSNLLSQLAE